MCTYNGGEYIKEQLISIIGQTVPPDEIVICDDGSTDNCVEIIENTLSRWDGHYRVIKNTVNLGFIKNFEKAISECQGDYIFLSDQDDVWDKEKINRVMKIFHEKPEVGLVFHNAYVTDERLLPKKKTMWEHIPFSPDNDQSAFFRYMILNRLNVAQGCSSAIRRKVFTSAYPFPENIYHDAWLFITAFMTSKLYPLPDTLLYYRLHENNIAGVGKENHGNKAHRGFIEKNRHLADINIKHIVDALSYYKICTERFRYTTDAELYNQLKANMLSLEARLIFIEGKNWIGLLNVFLKNRRERVLYSLSDMKRDFRSLLLSTNNEKN